MEMAGNQSLLSTLCKQWLQVEISIDRAAEMGDDSELLLLPRILQHSEETREIPERLRGSAQC